MSKLCATEKARTYMSTESGSGILVNGRRLILAVIHSSTDELTTLPLILDKRTFPSPKSTAFLNDSYQICAKGYRMDNDLLFSIFQFIIRQNCLGQNVVVH